MGRNLFYVVVVGGKVSCVDFVVKYLIELLKEVLLVFDMNREILIDIVCRLNYYDMERLFYKYMYSDRWDVEKCIFMEFGIEDCDLVCLDDFMEDRKMENVNIIFENICNDC